MFKRRVVIVVIISLFAASSAGCGSKLDRMRLKQAKNALKQGNMKIAIRETKTVLRNSQNNIFAKRLMKKIEAQLTKQAQEDLENKRYKQAVAKADMLLKDIDPQNEEVKALRANAKKHVLVDEARAAIEKDNPVAALQKAKEALRLDPQFQEAKNIQAEATKEVKEKTDNLMETAQELITQKKFKQLRDHAQDILKIDPQNREVAELLREAQAQLLVQARERNLEMARKFYAEGIYESALARAEKVLTVDPNSTEAKELVEKAKAEMTKPKLRLTGFTKIKGMEIAHIEMSKTRERFLVKEGEIFGPFKVSAIDLDLKAVVVTFVKTGSQQTLTTGTQ